MLMKMWTGSLLFLAWLSFCAWLVLVCREKNVHPLRDFAMFFKKQTTVGRVLFGTFFLIMWVYASVKPGDGGGNGGGNGGGDGGTSDARNSKIFNIFSLVKIGERSGMGLSQLYGNWEEAGYARPQISESFNPERTKVEIEVEVAEKVAENSSQVAEKQGEVAEKVAENRGEYTEEPSEYTEKYTEKQTEKNGEYTENTAQSIANLTETEERIVAILRQNKFATQGGISAQLGITRTYITKIMGGLQSRNIIHRIGPDKGGYWEVLGMANRIPKNGEES